MTVSNRKSPASAGFFNSAITVPREEADPLPPITAIPGDSNSRAALRSDSCPADLAIAPPRRPIEPRTSDCPVGACRTMADLTSRTVGDVELHPTAMLCESGGVATERLQRRIIKETVALPTHL